MKFKSHIISQGSGKVAGLVYSHNRAGLYTRNWRTPVNTPTDRRTEVRALMTSLVTAWTEQLSETQRQSWNDYAANVPVIDRLGDSIHITGQNWYVGANTGRLQASLDRIDDAPTIFDRGSSTPPNFVPNEPAQTIDVTFNDADEWCAEPGAALLVYFARPINGNRTFFKGPYVFVGAILGDAGTPPTSPATIPVPFPIAVNQAVGCRALVTRADGRYGTPTFRLPPVSPEIFVQSVVAIDEVTFDWYFSQNVTVGGPVFGWDIGAATGGYQTATALAQQGPNIVRSTQAAPVQILTPGQGYVLETFMTGITAAAPIVTPAAAGVARVFSPVVTAQGVADAEWDFSPGNVDVIGDDSILEIDAGGGGFIAPTSSVISGGKIIATYAVAPVAGDDWRIVTRPTGCIEYDGGGLTSCPVIGTVQP